MPRCPGRIKSIFHLLAPKTCTSAVASSRAMNLTSFPGSPHASSRILRADFTVIFLSFLPTPYRLSFSGEACGVHLAQTTDQYMTPLSDVEVCVASSADTEGPGASTRETILGRLMVVQGWKWSRVIQGYCELSHNVSEFVF